jgi:hypothetical protein
MGSLTPEFFFGLPGFWIFCFIALALTGLLALWENNIFGKNEKWQK